MALYRGVLGQGWQNAWRNKYLWFFGLFAALLGNGAEFRMMSEAGSEQTLFPTLQDIASTGVFSLQGLENLGKLMVKDPASVIILFLIFLLIAVLFVFLLWLSVVSQGALVNNAARFKNNHSHDFRSGLDSGIKHFWPVLGMNAILKIVIFVAFVILSFLLINSGARDMVGNILFVVFFVIFIPLVVVLSFIVKYAIAYVIIKGESFLNALRLGWQLFVRNWLISIEMAFILFFINFLAVVGLALLLLVLAIPFLFIMIVFSSVAVSFSFWFLFLASSILYILLAMWLGAVLSTFQVSSWTILFLELVSRGGVSKLIRLFGRRKADA